jgi:lysozyme family protein
MADSGFATCLAFTLRAEGGYVDNPADPGGAATYRDWSDDPDLGTAQMQDMTERTARAIYRSLYWNPLRADALPRGVDLSVFDMGVNAGIWRSARLLQRALGFSGDAVNGCVGPETLGAAARADARSLIADLATRQANYYRSLNDYDTFGAGWINRTEARRARRHSPCSTTAARSRSEQRELPSGGIEASSDSRARTHGEVGDPDRR